MENDRPEECPLCKEGQLLDRTERLSFHQYTDRGYVFCRVVIPMKICDRCGARSWDARADAIMDDAVRREYDKLPR
jgi:C4-type Zn-finger protein